MRSRLEIRPGHVHLQVEGRFDAEAARRAITELFEACAAGRLDSILVDARGIEGMVAIAERFEMARTLAEGRTGPVRIAVLVDASQMVTKTLEDSACSFHGPRPTNGLLAPLLRGAVAMWASTRFFTADKRFQ